ncbi:MAG: AI-2E family transporter [Pirellulales bacterium]
MASVKSTSRNLKREAELLDAENDNESAVGWFSRQRSLALALVGMLAIFLYLCYLLVLPFLSSIAWAGALAVIMHPLHNRIERRIGRPNLSAGISVVLAATAIVGPAYLILQALVGQAAEGIELLRSHADSIVARYPRLAPYWERINSGQLPEEAKDTMRELAGNVPTYLTGSVWFGAQLLITFFMLFYFLRDRRDIARALNSLMPLTRTETRRTMRRTEDTIFATIYGSLTVAAIQGFLGGFMFWMLGLPTPVLWGVIMAFLATIPMLGTFVVWGPAAAFLALEGDWWRAMALVAWGSVAIGLIDNIIYPLLVGKRLRLHPLPIFVAIVGGVSLFGAAGIVLGPVVLSITEALLDVWQRRTADGGTIEAGAESC